MKLICHTYFIHKALVFLYSEILSNTLAQSMEATLKSEITNPKPKTVKNGENRPQKDTKKSLLELQQKGIAFITLLDLSWTMYIGVTQTFCHSMHVCEGLWNCLEYWLGSINTFEWIREFAYREGLNNEDWMCESFYSIAYPVFVVFSS